jgi:pyruvate/2-oxoglutarate dehydrogenase complex dihydrolipoamide dehydrogenase (E3) component
VATRLLPDDPHDRELLARVRPPGWVNPTPTGRYHLVVLGAGTAGLVCAAGAAGLGARVALIERHLLGGDCLNAGCVPSKSLLAASRRGIAVPAAMERLRRQRAELAKHDSAERFRSLGVDVYFGEGRFVRPDAVEVAGRTLTFRRAVIATGTRPARPALPGACVTNEEVFALTELPGRLTVVGAGPVGCELAQAFARFGSRVTLVARAGQVLPREDDDAAAVVRGGLERDGVMLAAEPVAADVTLLAAGRVPNVEGLGLDEAGVAFDPARGVWVSDFLGTTNPRIFAAGDVCSAYKFTHAADAMARLVIRNALFWGWGRASRLVIPWCTYTDPELARVGLSLAEARERGVAVDVFELPFASVDRAVLDGEDVGFVRALVRKGTGRIVGVTAVGAHAGETIGAAALAMARGVGMSGLAASIFPYPTRCGRGWGESVGRPLEPTLEFAGTRDHKLVEAHAGGRQVMR